MGSRTASTVIATRVLERTDLESLMAQIGGFLAARGFTPLAHTPRFLDYELGTRGGRRKATALVQVTDLPIDFTAEDGSSRRVAAAYAFGVSAPQTLLQGITEIIAPYRVDLERASAAAGRLLEGMRFEKTIQSVACEHCGHLQDVTVPIEISRVEGDRGYGPGGSARVPCSGCGRAFEVEWDNLIVRIDMMP